MNPRPYVAELVGTFVLALVVCAGSTGTVQFPVAYIAALTVALFVYSVGSISGAHLNPAVTVGLASIKKLGVADAVYYLLAQMLGAILAMVVCYQLKGSLPQLGASDSVRVVVAEAIGAFMLVWSIMAVSEKKVHPAAAGLTIGFGLLIGILLGGAFGSYGLLNPAVAFAVGSFSASYLVGPIIGGVAAAWAYRWISEAHAPSHHAGHVSAQ